MGAILSVFVFCFCFSLSKCLRFCCESFLGNGETFAAQRKGSVVLLSLSIILAIFFQYFFVPELFLVDKSHSFFWHAMTSLTGLDQVIDRAWRSGYCATNFGSGDKYDSRYYQDCVGNTGVFRPTSIAFLFFFISMIFSIIQPPISNAASSSRSWWPEKYLIYFILICFSIFLPNEPFFNGRGCYFIFRAGSILFIVLQQIILIDIAYKWNEAWLDRANECDAIAWRSGIKWLRAIVTMCIILYSLCISGIIMLYHYFAKSGCGENKLIITLSCLGIIAVTGLQLYTCESSLLSSAVISTYITYLAYNIVSKNPNGVCNPALGKSDTFGIIVGLSLTMVSLAWTGYSWTADDPWTFQGLSRNTDFMSTGSSPEDSRYITQLEGSNINEPFLPRALDTERTNTFMNMSFTWKLNAILCVVTCWVAASLTSWGSVQVMVNHDGNFAAANPLVGHVNMTMIGVSQWIAIILYAWTLVAPRLYPDYDFSP